MTRVVVHVDRLVLRGVPHEEREAMARAVHEQLEHTFGSRETIRQVSTHGHLPRLKLSSPGAQPTKDRKR